MENIKNTKIDNDSKEATSSNNGIPMFITNKMKDKLKALGFTEEILTPTEAWNLLKGKEETKKIEPEKEEAKEKWTGVAPEIEAENFIKELDLESVLPPEFKNLNGEQKLKVIKDLKHRIVDVVKADAQTQYSKYLKDEISKKVPSESKIGKVWSVVKGIGSSLKETAIKEGKIKELERENFKNIKNTEEGKKLIAEDLKLLTDKAGKAQVWVELENLNYAEKNIVDNFNRIANEFRELPYEWGQEGKEIIGGNKKKYEKAKAEYEQARKEILHLKTYKETSKEKGKAIVEVLEMDNTIKLEQLLNTHPEFEKEFANLSEDKSYKDWLKAGGSIANTLTGKNWINRGLIAVGATSRALAKGAAIATSMTGITFIAAPIIGAVTGGLRAKFKSEDTLKERQKQARYGQKDDSKEKVLMTDATHLNKELEKAISNVENAKSEEERSKALSMLVTRIEHTQGKVEKGQVNFGETKQSLNNQYNLIDTLNKALVSKETSVVENNTELKKRIDSLLSKTGNKIANTTEEAQKEFIKKQMLKGAAMGAGFATAGYVTRWFGEEMGWWGQKDLSNIVQSTETSKEQAVAVTEAIKASVSPKVLETMDADSLNKLASMNPNTIKTFAQIDSSKMTNVLKMNSDTLSNLTPASVLKISQLSPDTLNKLVAIDSTTVNNLVKLPASDFEKTLEKMDVEKWLSPEKMTEHTKGYWPQTPEEIKAGLDAEKALKTAKEIAKTGELKNKIIEKLEQGDLKNAIVGGGGGVTQAFAKQITANHDLAKELGFTGDFDNKNDIAKFTKALAIKTGYMDSEGHEIRVAEANKVAYVLKAENGHVVVDEKNVDGSSIETHNEGDKFENPADKHEYNDDKIHKYSNLEKVKTDHPLTNENSNTTEQNEFENTALPKKGETIIEHNDGIYSVDDAKGNLFKTQFKYDKNHNVVGYTILTERTNGDWKEGYINRNGLAKLNLDERRLVEGRISSVAINIKVLESLDKNTKEYEYLYKNTEDLQNRLIRRYGDVFNHSKMLGKQSEGNFHFKYEEDSKGRIFDRNGVDQYGIDKDGKFIEGYESPKMTKPMDSTNTSPTHEVNITTDKAINDLYEKNTTKIFGTGDEKIKILNAFNKIPAAQTLGLEEKNLESPMKELAKYLHKLKDVTGFEPKSGNLIRSAETNDEYIKRALAKAAELGKLDQVKL